MSIITIVLIQFLINFDLNHCIYSYLVFLPWHLIPTNIFSTPQPEQSHQNTNPVWSEVILPNPFSYCETARDSLQSLGIDAEPLKEITVGLSEVLHQSWHPLLYQGASPGQ